MTGRARRLPMRKRPGPEPTATAVLFDDEFVVYCQRTERMHCLDRPASVVWALCDGTRTVDAVIDEVAGLAGSEPDAVRPDVVATVERFRELGILR